MNYISDLQNQFIKKANKKEAAKMKAYLKNHFAFLGLKAPVRRELQKTHKAKWGIPSKIEANLLIHQLWQLDEREYQHAALDLFERFLKKLDFEDIQLIESLILKKSWWDTVDALAVKMAGAYFKKFPEQIQIITEQWNESSNRWLNRSALLFQLKYKEQIDQERLFRYILNHCDSKEFFIQKAIGWTLREYSKTQGGIVEKFITEHQSKLAALSKREGMKWLNKDS